MADELAVVEVVATEPEAELMCSLLRGAGIRCVQRLSNRGAGVGDGGYALGPRERPRRHPAQHRRTKSPAAAFSPTARSVPLSVTVT